MMHALDDVTTLVLAPNPSPLTLEGTNTYLLGAPGAGEVIVVDPGPALRQHRDALDAAFGELGAHVGAVVVTHHHADHAEAVGWAEQWRAPLFAFEPRLLPRPATTLRDGDVVERGGVRVQAVYTPGHASDHLCLRVLETDVVLTGDHILGRGTTVVAWPDGDMGAYLASLRRVRQLGARALYPGHGPTLEHPGQAIDTYLAHRLEREEQVLAAIAAGATTPGEIVRRVYADVDAVLHPAAELSVRAHVDKLVAEGRVQRTDEGELDEGELHV